MLSLVLALLVTAPANLKIDDANPKLPRPFKATATVVALATFEDTNGSHTVYIEQGVGKTGDLELRAYDWAGKAKLWQANDFVRECELDQLLAYRDKSLSVTDIDGDGVAEVGFAYEMTCAGDVSPHTLKVLTYEGSEKFAARGETIVDAGNGNKVGGTYVLDPPEAKWPAGLVAFVKKRWDELARVTR